MSEAVSVACWVTPWEARLFSPNARRCFFSGRTVTPCLSAPGPSLGLGRPALWLSVENFSVISALAVAVSTWLRLLFSLSKRSQDVHSSVLRAILPRITIRKAEQIKGHLSECRGPPHGRKPGAAVPWRLPGPSRRVHARPQQGLGSRSANRAEPRKGREFTELPRRTDRGDGSRRWGRSRPSAPGNREPGEEQGTVTEPGSVPVAFRSVC